MDDFKQTGAIIRYFFKIRDESVSGRDIDRVASDLEKTLDLLECSNSFNYFTEFYISKLWKNVKKDIQNTLKKIEGYKIVDESGTIVAKTKEGEWIEVGMVLPREFVVLYCDIPEEYEDFAEIYFHQPEENIMAQILHLGYTYGLNN